MTLEDDADFYKHVSIASQSLLEKQLPSREPAKRMARFEKQHRTQRGRYGAPPRRAPDPTIPTARTWPQERAGSRNNLRIDHINMRRNHSRSYTQILEGFDFEGLAADIMSCPSSHIWLPGSDRREMKRRLREELATTITIPNPVTGLPGRRIQIHGRDKLHAKSVLGAGKKVLKDERATRRIGYRLNRSEDGWDLPGEWIDAKRTEKRLKLAKLQARRTRIKGNEDDPTPRTGPRSIDAAMVNPGGDDSITTTDLLEKKGKKTHRGGRGHGDNRR